MKQFKVYKITDTHIIVKEIPEKVKYIKEHFSDNSCTMVQFIGSQKVFSEHLPKVLSSTKFKEGVDLSMYNDFIISSNSYSGNDFAQLRERNVNINNTSATKVHYLLVKGGISDTVFETCSKKLDYNNEIFRKTKKELA